MNVHTYKDENSFSLIKIFIPNNWSVYICS
jgi:hypothetical protein